MHRILSPLPWYVLACVPFASLASGQSGWVIDTLLPNDPVFGAGSVAATLDVVVAARSDLLTEAALEIHRFDGNSGRYVLEETIRDPAWWPLSWLGTSAHASGPVTAVFCGVPLTHAMLVILEDGLNSQPPGSGWIRQDLQLGIDSHRGGGKLVDVDSRRIAAVTGLPFQPLLLNIVERHAAGPWQTVQTLPLSLRAAWPPFIPTFIDLDGDVAVVTGAFTQPVATFVVCVRDDATGIWSERSSLRVPSPAYAVAGVALEGPWLVLGLQPLPPIPPESVAWVLERLANGELVRRQELRLPGAPPMRDSNVLLQSGRLVVSGVDDAHVFERDATGRFVEIAHYRGLGSAQAILDGASPAPGQTTAADRIVGRDGRVARIAPFPPPASPGGGIPTVDVRQDVGVSVCEPSAAAALELRYFDGVGVPLNQPLDRRAATVAGAPPGATVVLFAAHEPASWPAAGGTLCLERSTLYVAAPVTAAGSSGAVAFDLRTGPVPAPNVGEHVLLQALVRTAVGPQLTNAVHFVR